MIFKINQSLTISVFIFYLFLFTGNKALSQSNFPNKYGLFIVNNLKLLLYETDLDSNKMMLDVKKAIPTIVLDLRYATKNNFMHHPLYPQITTTYLRLPAIRALQKIATELRKANLGIKIFDTYRPYSVTEKMWEEVKDSRYAADPAKGSGHNRGIAVDLTLIDLQSGKELPMGTGFDNFSDTAHHDFKSLPVDILQNRLLLKNIMVKYGFVSLDTEWWHYNLPNADSYELLNIPFIDLKKINRSLTLSLL